MGSFKIITDSTCDMPAEIASRLEIAVVSLRVRIGAIEYENKLDGSVVTPHEFFEMLRQGSLPQTSCPNIEDYRKVIEPFLQSGTDILYLGFSSTLSSSYANGCMTVNMLSEEYPERKLYCVDTLSGSMGMGLLVLRAAQMCSQGASLEETAHYVEGMRLQMCHWFSVTDIAFLRRGGRLNAAAAAVGSLLKLRPIIGLTEERNLKLMGIVKGEKAMLRTMVEKVRRYGKNLSVQTVGISHADCPEVAEKFRAMLQDQLGIQDFVIHTIGPVMGAHCGPDCLAVFFLGRPVVEGFAFSEAVQAV